MCQHCKKSENDTRCICRQLDPTPMPFLRVIEEAELEAAREWIKKFRAEDKLKLTEENQG